MTDLKDNLEEVWRKEYEDRFEVDALSKDYYSKFGRYDTESECEKWEMYKEARKKAQEDIEFWKNEYVSHSEAMCKCQEELQKTREQLNTCEKLLMRFVPDEKTIQWEQRELDAKRYFKNKDKQGE